MTFGHEQMDVCPLNIEEGNGEATDGDRRRFFEMAEGWLSNAARCRMFLRCGAMAPEANAGTSKLLDHIVAMLTRLGQRGYTAGEQPATMASGESMPIPIPTPTPINRERRTSSKNRDRHPRP
jgi:hypothetical protein